MNTIENLQEFVYEIEYFSSELQTAPKGTWPQVWCDLNAFAFPRRDPFTPVDWWESNQEKRKMFCDIFMEYIEQDVGKEKCMDQWKFTHKKKKILKRLIMRPGIKKYKALLIRSLEALEMEGGNDSLVYEIKNLLAC